MMRKSAAHITVNSAPPPGTLKPQPFGTCTLNVMTSISIKTSVSQSAFLPARLRCYLPLDFIKVLLDFMVPLQQSRVATGVVRCSAIRAA
jgi:hypothetical protein